MTTNRRSVRLTWTGRDLVFEGRAGDAPPSVLDGGSREGPSPMATLLLSLAGCMAVDVKDILTKGRVPVTDLEVEVEGDRAREVPRRFTHVRMRIRVAGPEAKDRATLDRAVQLSRDRYCSVFHTLRSDLEVTIDAEIRKEG